MRKTKIVCTVGPACADEKIFSAMCLAGMNVARLNFSHGTHEEHLEKIKMIKKVRSELGLPIAIMLDTKGPEYRIGTFAGGKIELHEGDEFRLTSREIEGDEKCVSVNYKGLVNDINAGDRILINNGLVILEAESTTDTDVVCRVISGGELSNRKSMSFPNKVMKQEYLSEQDKADIAFGIENGVDFIACSFVSTRRDLMAVNEYVASLGGKADIIAKIENRSGVDNIEEICKECSGIMIGRGDMGVEIPFEELPYIQKSLITKCRLLGKRVITATEMLESMIHNPRPTRAEISDVANAVYDGTSAIMLSGETAVGEHPVLTVQTMSKIAEEAEKNICYDQKYKNEDFEIKSISDAISHATVGMAIDIKAKAIVACSRSGLTARMVSRFRPSVDIIGMTTNEENWRKLSLSWGVIPVMSEEVNSVDVLFYTASKIAQRTLSLSRGDKIIITGGLTNGVSGNTSLIKIEQI